MKKAPRFILYTIIGIIAFLFFTNPTLNDFKEFVPTFSKSNMRDQVAGKEHNYIIFSIYKFEYNTYYFKYSPRGSSNTSIYQTLYRYRKKLLCKVIFSYYYCYLL